MSFVFWIFQNHRKNYLLNYMYFRLASIKLNLSFQVKIVIRTLCFDFLEYFITARNRIHWYYFMLTREIVFEYICFCSVKRTLHKKMKFFIEDFFSKCDQIRRKLSHFVTCTEEIPKGKFHFLFSVSSMELWVFPLKHMGILMKLLKSWVLPSKRLKSKMMITFWWLSYK